MKILILSVLLWLIVIPCLALKSFDSAEKEMLLKVTDAYSQCAAYYEIAGMLLSGKNQGQAKKQAKRMKKESQSMAFKIAEQLVASDISDKKKAQKVAKNLTVSNYQAAINKLNYLAKNDQQGLKRKADSYRKGCSKAISDPGAFSASILNGIRKKKSKKQNPNLTDGGQINIDSKKLIQHLNNPKPSNQETKKAKESGH